ncbi:MAG: hypothetical protein P1V20_02740 [Verrucomicrobiales bacterium]|nr:hypothetical protein [Verrucomicrobiales bacterium]
MNRRDCLKSISATGAAAALPGLLSAQNDAKFAFKYVLASTMYGNMKLSRILPELEHTGCEGLDIWCKPHGTQREEIDKMGVDSFAAMLKNYDAKALVFTCLPAGCYGLKPEMPVMQKLGGKIIVSSSPSVEILKGSETRAAVKKLIEEMAPHADEAAEHGLTIALKNGPGQVLSSPESILHFGEFNRHPSLGIALAPQYLKKDILRIPEIILELGNRNLSLIYLQEHGDGAFHKLQKTFELEQLPGRGTLSYSVVAKALKLIEFSGYAEISMYTTPRGLPALEDSEQITELINESRIYVDNCVRNL